MAQQSPAKTECLQHLLNVQPVPQCWLQSFGLWHCVVLMHSSKTLITTYKTTQCHNPQDDNQHPHYCNKLKSQLVPRPLLFCCMANWIDLGTMCSKSPYLHCHIELKRCLMGKTVMPTGLLLNEADKTSKQPYRTYVFIVYCLQTHNSKFNNK
jgi:hypothetical protein